jgi:hypothetical protein
MLIFYIRETSHAQRMANAFTEQATSPDHFDQRRSAYFLSCFWLWFRMNSYPPRGIKIHKGETRTLFLREIRQPDGSRTST